MNIDIEAYEFHVDDEVITIDGEKGKIVDICDCEYCRERGFLEPVWLDESGDEEWITVGQAERGFTNYYKIGKYRFHPFNKAIVEYDIATTEAILERYRKRLRLIEELEEKDREENLL